MRRLLIATTVPETLRAFMLPLARHLRTRGWRVDALARGAAACPRLAVEFTHVWDAPWSRNILDPANLLHAPSVVRDLVSQEGYDLVHVHTPVAGFVTRFALRTLRRPEGRPRVLYTAHGFHFYHGAPAAKYWTFLSLEKLAARWMDYLVLVNQDDVESALRHRLIGEDRVYHTPGVGIDLSRFDPRRVTTTERMHVRKELGIDASAALFLVVAEFIPRKRHADVIRAFAGLADREAHLALAGAGPLVEEMRTLAARLGVGDRVHFLGFREDVPSLALASSALVLASSQEGLPTCVIEAQCLGVPVIGSDIRGTRELLQHGRGLLFPLGDVDSLREAMMRVISDRAGVSLMAERASAAAHGYDAEHVNLLYEALYLRALGDA